MAEIPTGTVTFLFTDIEGSSRLREEQREAMQAALARRAAGNYGPDPGARLTR
jgi:class 3 adenylate cyclase